MGGQIERIEQKIESGEIALKLFDMWVRERKKHREIKCFNNLKEDE